MTIDPIELAIRQIYDAAWDDAAWAPTMRTISEGPIKSITGVDHRALCGGADPLFLDTGIDPVVAEEVFANYTSPKEHIGLAAMMRARVGAPFRLEDFVDKATFDRDPGVRLFFHRQGFDKGLFVCLERDDASLSYFSFFRRTHEADFGPDEALALARLAPHVVHAYRIRDLRLDRARAAAGAAALRNHNGAAAGVLFLDGSLNVLHADAGAEALLASGAPLGLRRRRLVSASNRPGQGTEEVHAFLRAALGGDATMTLANGDGRVLRLSAAPTSPDMAANASILLIIDTAPSTRPIDLVAFAVAHELTPAERRFLDAFLSVGASVKAAHALEISPNTAKSHLRAIFQKTGCATQAQLMRLLSGFR